MSGQKYMMFEHLNADMSGHTPIGVSGMSAVLNLEEKKF
jgi:hypothetical protein